MAAIDQMINRMHSGHANLLRMTLDGRKLDGCTFGDITAWGTLVRWGAVKDGKVTPIGEELLARWSQPRKAKVAPAPKAPAWKSIAWVAPGAGEELNF